MGNDQYLDLFIEESEEHLQAINTNLLELEREPTHLSYVEEIFRSAHTLKGMAATMGYEDLANLTHEMENVLDEVRNEQISVTTELIDIIFKSVDLLEAMVSSIIEGGDGKRDVSEVVSMLEKAKNGISAHNEDKESEREDKSHKDQDVPLFDEYHKTVISQAIEEGRAVYHMTVHLADECILKAARVFMVFEVLETMGDIIKTEPAVDDLEDEKFDNHFGVTLISEQDQKDIKHNILNVSEITQVNIQVVQVDQKGANAGKDRQKNKKHPPTEKDSSPSPKSKSSYTRAIRVNIERIDQLMNSFEELLIDKVRLEQMAKEANHTGILDTVEKMSRASNDLQNIILDMRMVPIEQVFNRFPKMVRNLAKELDKKVELEMIGSETELDRTVVDQMGDPLVHLIRNSMDHGIESPQKRVQNGKPEKGELTLQAFHSGNDVIIEIKDDGAGINREKVIEKAVGNGVISAENAEKLADAQVYDLLFAPGFSTADQVSDVSGRGVGLDVVRNTIESLSGSITVDSTQGQGSIFSIQLPLTLSIINSLLIQVENETYAIPLTSIMETAVVRKDQIKSVHAQEVILLRDRTVPLVFLKDIFDLPHQEEEEFYPVVIVQKGNNRLAIAVDSFIGQHEIVIKSLGNYLKNVFAISGSTILGNGEVALILDCNALMT